MPFVHETEQKLVNALAKARQQRGLSYNDIAARTGLHYTAISLIERGKRHMTLLVFLKICAALGLDPASLFGDEANARPSPAPLLADRLPTNESGTAILLHENKKQLKQDD